MVAGVAASYGSVGRSETGSCAVQHPVKLVTVSRPFGSVVGVHPTWNAKAR
ncbi:hypothetical protein NEUTE1DRAFT_137299 [Neurospora tetrasperma FGSC 2508]|uniref:Uncharacterized protein n=1 Tax=Neurospora tetrasperma (strain FGSC 2508 / ATCC MYA-4615 / P0657) TaxID=510951 RepID=F8MKU4_NEUT8|nr:uncharacterized protein NEUTE1DRAFT_137299 [Neurospora tetrasperma FGSC 2508]EGO57472.1 hypothetical protein NEUTE1DRAFT_137299 [Neurospora tetrasperma FGSC 2508]